jgi:ATP-dependent exoDNAse (exonuclease V) beta subunit
VAFIQQNAGADLSAFLHWWEESGKGKTISTPEGMDAIQIMTIHKSKGLEFKAVIVPFADWDFNGIRNGMRENIIWIEPKIPPFNQIPLLPLKYSSTLSKTLFFEEYLQERVETTVDNLNLAYVAFTRAEEELIIFAPKEAEKEEKKSKDSERKEKYRFMGHLLADVLLADGGVDAVERKAGYEYAEFAGNRGMETRSFVLDDTAESADDASGASEDDDAEGETDRTDVKIHYFEIGADWAPTAKAEKPRSGNTCFVKVGDTMDEDEKPEKATAELVDLNSFASEDYTSRLQQRLNSKGFFEENANRALGTKMHEVLASIATTADVDRAVAQSVRKGILTVDERDAVAAELKRLLASDPLISSWYAPEARVVNEMNILFPSDTSKSALRPDRIIFYEGGRRVVVVDYKFGDRTRKAYVAQVKEYIDAIKAMGYEQVEGYLWYVEREEIVRV